MQLSGLNELSFGKPALRNSRVGYTLAVETSIPAKAAARYFPELDSGEQAKYLTLHSTIDLSFRYREVAENRSGVVVDRFDLLSEVQGMPGPRLSVRFQNKEYRAKVEGHGIRLHGRGRKRRTIQRATGLAGGNNFLPGLLLLDAEVDDEGEDKPPPVPVPLDPILRNPLRDLEKELTERLSYLGPLREEPRRAYLHSGSPFFEIGKKGEYAAQILSMEREAKVDYSASLERESEELTLMEAINEAFITLGLGQSIDVKSERSIVYQILLGIDGSGKKQVTIADVGFGVSQLLPIVVMSLRSPKSSLLLFEQPEIHLHPKLQANLADFFLTLTSSGKRLVIETHSDHFINRLRRRVAEDRTDKLADDVSILFVHPPEDGQGTVIQPLRVDPYGVIENWPPDFLPESANEAGAIFRAGLEKRQER